MLLVMQATRNAALQRRSASTICGRMSPLDRLQNPPAVELVALLARFLLEQGDEARRAKPRFVPFLPRHWCRDCAH